MESLIGLAWNTHCGSGNFLYLALQALKDLEREAILWGSLTLNVPMQFPEVGPQAVLGIEVNSYAAELARVVIWIGEIQWMLGNGFAYVRDPILRPLNNIECRDAILDLSDSANPREPKWPEATVIVGNPPFLGGLQIRSAVGDEYMDALLAVFRGRLPGNVDLVTYWYEKARDMVEAGKVRRVGLLATQGIRGGANRRVLERIKKTGEIFVAWSDEPWVLDGAAVHVSFVGFDDGSESERMLNGEPVSAINANLASGVDLTSVGRLPQNCGMAFQGPVKVGPFEISSDLAALMLNSPNPDGRSNGDVIRPWVNGADLTGRLRRMWIIDFAEIPLEKAVLYEMPFEYVKEHVRPVRIINRDRRRRDFWWQPGRSGKEMRTALRGLSRFICTPTTSKYRVFVWVDGETLPSQCVIAFARDDDYFFGVLHSSVHELWARRLGTQLREVESGFRYTPTTTFETFPFPDCDDEAKEQIARAARSLDERRNGWLNPPGVSEAELKKRTLTEAPRVLRRLFHSAATTEVASC